MVSASSRLFLIDTNEAGRLRIKSFYQHILPSKHHKKKKDVTAILQNSSRITNLSLISASFVAGCLFVFLLQNSLSTDYYHVGTMNTITIWQQLAENVNSTNHPNLSDFKSAKLFMHLLSTVALSRMQGIN